MFRKWEDLPKELQKEEIKPYYECLKRKQMSLLFKRVFDIVASSLLLVLLCPVFVILAVAIKLDSPGPVFYRQVRVTQYGNLFRIFKFRSMVQGADKGSQVTVGEDNRITRVGKLIRKCRLDEICQLIDILRGTMTFVGTRPEVPKYVAAYTPQMLATLLLPAGVTSEASIFYKDEDALLTGVEDVDTAYVKEVLPGKMYYNLKAIENFGFWKDIKIMIMTVLAVLGKEFKEKDIIQPNEEEKVIS